MFPKTFPPFLLTVDVRLNTLDKQFFLRPVLIRFRPRADLSNVRLLFVRRHLVESIHLAEIAMRQSVDPTGDFPARLSHVSVWMKNPARS